MAVAQTLRVAAADRPPFVFVDEARIGNARFYGLLPDLVPVLLAYAGQANTTLQYYAIQNAGGDFVNGTWTGAMGELTSGRADLAAFPLSLVAPRPDYAALSHSYFNGGVGILISAQKKAADPLSFLNPFSPGLWVAILGALLSVAAVGSLLARLSPLGRFEVKRVRWLDADTEHAAVAEYVIQSANDSAMMEAAATQLGQMPQPRSRSWAVRLLTLAYGAFAIVILSSYTANLAAFMTVKQLSAKISSPVELLRSGGTFAVGYNGSTYAYFRNALDPVAAALASRMRAYNSTQAAVAAVRSGAVTAYLTDAPTLQWYAAQLPCDVTVSGESFGPNSLTLGMPLGSPLLRPLNEALLEVMSNGVLDQLIRKWMYDLSQCPEGAQAQTNRLDLPSSAGLFYMMLLAAAAALAVAAAERLVPHAVASSPRMAAAAEAANAAWQRLSIACLQPGRYMPDQGFSKSSLEISRSFRRRGKSLYAGNAAVAEGAGSRRVLDAGCCPRTLGFCPQDSAHGAPSCRPTAAQPRHDTFPPRQHSDVEMQQPGGGSPTGATVAPHSTIHLAATTLGSATRRYSGGSSGGACNGLRDTFGSASAVRILADPVQGPLYIRHDVPALLR